MKILIVGSGGREHALAWKIAQSPRVTKIFCAPGNAGIAKYAECVNIKAMDIPALLAFAKDQHIDLAVIGPESPLIAGIVDEFESVGISAFGPSKAAARIEGSKVFSKELMAKYGIPTADFRIFDRSCEAREHVESLCEGDECRVVVKAYGEALGKGAIVCGTKDEALGAIKMIMEDRVFGSAGDWVVIEERLEGPEASLMVFSDGESVVPLPAVQDHKRIFDGDKGSNTGGMGCYSPVPVVPPLLYDQVLDTIIKPTIDAMNSEGCPYAGLLYTGIILTEHGPKVIEYNARFGDPETQVALPLLDGDIVDIMAASAAGSLDSDEVKCYNKCAVCVVCASGGYPGDYETGKPISGLDAAESISDLMVFHAGTKLQDGQVVTNGGRVLGVTAVGDTFQSAIDRAYSAVDEIHFDGMFFRRDIGSRALGK
jgi:phosphoribosylamine--glycine ligase